MSIGVTKKRFAVNVVMNWTATAVNMIVPFFLTPFVVHHLGSTAYGVWILAVSTTSYLGLLDLGLRSAIIRYVSKAHAQSREVESNDVISTALIIRILIALVVACASVVLAFVTPKIFKLPAGLVQAAQITVLMCALGVAINLVSGVFSAVLSALNRFDVLSSITMSQTIFRATGVLLLLLSGRGLISLAYWEIVVILSAAIATTFLVLRIYPPALPRIGWPSRELLRTLWSYSFTTFVFMLAVQIIVNTDSLVIGAVLSVTMVTFFTIGSSLISYAQQVSSAVSTMFVPMASGLEASGRFEDLRRLLIRGTQGMLGLSLPIAIALFFRGETFINLWMGPQYGQISETVLRILTIALFLSMADSTASAIIMAMGRHKMMTIWTVGEALLNLGISVVLAKKLGLYGVAWGTSISMVIIHLAFYPRAVQKELGVPTSTFLWEGWAKISLCCVPYGFLCWYTERMWHAQNLLVFFAQITAILPVYGLGILALFRREARAVFHKWRTAVA